MFKGSSENEARDRAAVKTEIISDLNEETTVRQLDDMLLDAFTVLDTLQKRAEAAMPSPDWDVKVSLEFTGSVAFDYSLWVRITATLGTLVVTSRKGMTQNRIKYARWDVVGENVQAGLEDLLATIAEETDHAATTT